MKNNKTILIALLIIIFVVLLIHRRERIIKIKVVPDVVRVKPVIQPPFHRPQPIDYQISSPTIAVPFR